MRLLTLSGVLVATTVAAVPARAQQTAQIPHAGYVYPAGGQQGTTFQVQVGGQYLNGVGGAFVSGTGVSVSVAGVDRPILGQALTALRDTVQALVKGIQQQGADPATQRRILAIRDTIIESVRRQQNPSLAEIVTLNVTIAGDAEPGQRRLRLQTPVGLTSPLVFCVGQLPEFREIARKETKADGELAITLPAVVNGRLIPGDIARARTPQAAQNQFASGDVDRYRFHAPKGLHLVATVDARTLMPYLGDAVPGWIQATLTLYDAHGRELAYNDDYRFHPDPVIQYDIPADGEYVIEIKDALYRGRDDFVYRISIGELPFLTSVYPLGGRAGARTDLALTGWNLASNRTVLDATNKRAGRSSIAAAIGAHRSNSLPVALDTFPEVSEREPNDTRARATSVALPVIINGRIDHPGDRDIFSFTGKAGDTIVAEVTARRLESPLDAVLELSDAAGKRLAWNDDHEDKGAGLETHHADSWLMATLPAAGTYYVQLRDVQQHGGPEYAYRLRISSPQPDFELRVSPSSISVPGGNSVPVTVTAIRRDGFAGDIAVALANAPRGFLFSGGVIPAGQEQIRTTLTAPAAVRAIGGQGAAPMPVALQFSGHATIAGRTVTHDAVPADDMMQAFAYRHLVPADDTWVSVLARGGTMVASRVVTPLPLRFATGGTVQVRAAIPPGYRTLETIQCRLSEPPDGVTLTGTTLDASGITFSLTVDPAKVKPGVRGNLIVEITGERVPPANAQRPAGQAPPQRQRVVAGILPALPFEIVK